MGNEVPATKTPVTEYQASVYLVVALTNALQSALPERVAVYSMALAWVETARGQALIQNNAGNLTAGSGWTGDYWRPPWYPEDHDPKYDALHAKMLAGQAPNAFRAYPDPQAGWNAFAYEVVRRPTLVAAMNADDPSAVVQALHDTYSGDYGSKHVDTFRKLVAEFRSRNLFGGLPGAPAPGSVATTATTKPKKDGTGGGMLAAILLGVTAALGTAAYLLMRKRR